MQSGVINHHGGCSLRGHQTLQIGGLMLRVYGRVYYVHQMHVLIIHIVQGKVAHPPQFVPLDEVIISLFFVDSYIVHVGLFAAMQVGM